MKTLLLLLLAGLLRPISARADARFQAEETRRAPGSYDGERVERRGDVYYDGERRERRPEWDRNNRRRDDRYGRREPARPTPEGRSGSWVPSWGGTFPAVAGVAGGVVVGFMAFALLGTGPFGLIIGAIAAIGAAVAIGYFLS